MAYAQTKLSNKLKQALLHKGIIVYLDTEEFYSEKQNRLIKMYILSQRVFDEKKNRYCKQQLLKTADHNGIVQYLADMYKEVVAQEKAESENCEN